MIPLLDLAAPIEPGVGLGGLRIGERIDAYRDLLNAAHTQYDFPDDPEGPRWCEFWNGPWGLRYRLGQVYDQTDAEFFAMADATARGDVDGAVSFLQSPEHGFVRTARVYTLAALGRYEGSLCGWERGERSASHSRTTIPTRRRSRA